MKEPVNETGRRRVQARSGIHLDESASRTDRLQQRDETQYQYVGLARLTQAIGGCATEVATGSVKVAGGLLTDLVGACLNPVDRVIGSGPYTWGRERYPESDPRRDSGFSAAISRAAGGVADTATRSEERFRDILDESHAEALEKTDPEGLVGQIVTLDKPILNGSGSVQIAGRSWRVTGPDTPVGKRVMVTGGQGHTLLVERAGD
jgi:hypothetical protein